MRRAPATVAAGAARPQATLFLSPEGHAYAELEYLETSKAKYHSNNWNEIKLIVYLWKYNHVIMVTVESNVKIKQQVRFIYCVNMPRVSAFKLCSTSFIAKIENLVNMINRSSESIIVLISRLSE